MILALSEGIGELGSRLLASALPKSRLSALTLWRNKVGNGGARALADALSHASTVLTSLDLHDTTIGPQGAAAIAQALAGGAANTAYDSREESSYESYANITVNTSAAATAGVARVEELSTPRPPPLAWLSLEGNPLGDDGAAALAWALPKSRLTELHLARCVWACVSEGAWGHLFFRFHIILRYCTSLQNYRGEVIEFYLAQLTTCPTSNVFF